MLVVAYALAGNLKVDITREPLGHDAKGKPVYLKDIWPSNKEIAAMVRKYVTPAMFKKRYADVFKGDPNWRKINVASSKTYGWNGDSTRSEEHTSELQSLMRISYAVFCLKKKNTETRNKTI